jgi:hypothetical protein
MSTFPFIRNGKLHALAYPLNRKKEIKIKNRKN